MLFFPGKSSISDQWRLERGNQRCCHLSPEIISQSVSPERQGTTKPGLRNYEETPRSVGSHFYPGRVWPGSS